ncbi:hypothetical protein PISMIDRAFT_142403 [Pisolithus microcarpus 441]|uniref:Uncharacterized protein n=1 Tax=Pisolithus microcarpus 441 TaxID=765257 RepID=A0A0D0A6Y4_9AGAM|nr:hypothetical protein PISMIDRAFT_142403 [Pisolithus microcarpus 441]
MPILMLSGERDGVVPPRHMKELWEIASRRQGTMVDGRSGNGDVRVESGGQDGDLSPEVGNGRSKFVKFPYGGHNDTFVQADYWPTVVDFVKSPMTLQGIDNSLCMTLFPSSRYKSRHAGPMSIGQYYAVARCTEV